MTAAIFWAKTRMRWRETVVNEHQIESRDATLEERQARAKAMLDEAFGKYTPPGTPGGSLGRTGA